MKIIPLKEEEKTLLSKKLDLYDLEHMGSPIEGEIALGIHVDGELVAGLEGQMTAFKIFYLSVLFVEEKYRRQGLGRALIENGKGSQSLRG